MIVDVRVSPESRRFSISFKDGILRVCLISPPENNRANVELVSGLSKLLGKQVRVISGHTSKRKRLSIDITQGEWSEFLAKLPEMEF